MRLVVATNFDDELIEKIKTYPVTHVFGSHTKTITGHGRASFILPNVDDERFKAHLDVVHSAKIKFLYTMNTATLNGKEYSEKYIEMLKKEIDKLVNFGVDGFIVALPFLVKLIKRDYPNLEVSISSFARIYNIREAESYAEMGADTIILHEDDNRNFKLLEALKKLNIDIEIITNNSCLWGCPYRRTHDIISSISSNTNQDNSFWFEYPVLFCATDVRNDLANIIRMRWVRPEDLSVYEKIGIDRFKIAGRNKKTNWLVKVVEAYAKRKYEGNLLDIVSYPQGRAVPKVMKLVKGPNYYDVLENIYVDNTKFPSNWLEFFKHNDCDTRSCKECQYCDIIAKKVITIDGKYPVLDKVDVPIELIPKFSGNEPL